MVGITLTAEQIRGAPSEVRHWLEQELATALGLRPRHPGPGQPRREHLVACTMEEATKILHRIGGALPAVNVFFELGRQGAGLPNEGLEAFRLVDIVNHTRLQNVGQVLACLRLINEVLRDVRCDPDATLYAIDQHGDCFIAAQTQEAILRVWLQVVGGQVIHAVASADARRAPASTYRTEGAGEPAPHALAEAR